MKKFLAALLSLVMILALLAGCGASTTTTTPTATASTETASTETATTDTTEATTATTPTYVIKLGHACSAAHPYNQGAEAFKQEVEERTNGDISVEIYTDSTLGAERDLIEGLQMGTVEMCLVSTAPLSSYTDAFLAFDLPYLMTTKDQARGVCDSEIGQSMLDTLTDNGIVGLCYYENGFRHFTNDDHVIDDPTDLKGMKIRVMENQVMMATITACGGSPTPMAFNELYTALQQKTIDGEENPIGQIYDKKFYEVQHYISLSYHFYAPAPLLISASFFNSLPEEYQTIIQEAAVNSRDYERTRIDAEEESQLDEMINTYGCEVCDTVDIDAFKAATQVVYDEYVGEGKLIDPDIVSQIQNYTP